MLVITYIKGEFIIYRKLLDSSILATSILSLLLVPTATFAEPVSSETLTAADGKKVKVFHSEKIKVADVNLKDVVSKAKAAVKEEKTKSNSETFDYILFDDQQIYTYEETPASPDGELVVSDATTPAQTLSAMATSGQTDFIDDGVGGKQKISKVGSVGSYLSTVLKLPTGSSQVSDVSSSHSPYNYAGFEYTNTANSGIGSWQSDMGLQYYQNLGFSGTASGWKPILTLKQKTGADTWTALSN